MKKIIITSLILGLFAFSALPALATASITSDDVGLGYGTYTGLGTKDLRESVMTIVNVLLGFLGIIAIIVILYGGFVWLTAGGNEEKVSQAKKIISAGIIGLVVIFTSYAIAQFVINALIEATTGVDTL
ncbi:MAG TPA: hypothetical protein VJG65_00425 [Patescibacteria group bacterium]|nr:hypothetical protein [Patescibacteria group bacterium]